MFDALAEESSEACRYRAMTIMRWSDILVLELDREDDVFVKGLADPCPNVALVALDFFETYECYESDPGELEDRWHLSSYVEGILKHVYAYLEGPRQDAMIKEEAEDDVILLYLRVSKTDDAAKDWQIRKTSVDPRSYSPCFGSPIFPHRFCPLSR